ncbi:MAG: transcriptional regulator, MarR family [Herbinix sp.]|jgi:DNA-binding MarR family transcriptional regulator|nr:transcriptional regulator, MarR family [Herbinix sp.]
MIEQEEQHIGKRIRIISNLVRRKIDNVLSQKGMELTSSQGRIISFVYRQIPIRNVYQRDIEMEFDIRRSTATNTLQLLEKSGYISRVSVDEDARLKKILLTEKGIGICKVIRESISEVEGGLKNIYTTEELTELFYLLDKLYAALEE